MLDLESTIINLQEALGSSAFFKIKRTNRYWIAQTRIYTQPEYRQEFAGHGDTPLEAFNSLIEQLINGGQM